MINWGIGLLILGIIGITLQWNPILDPFQPILDRVIENLGLIQATFVSCFVGAVLMFIVGSRSKP